MSNPFSFNPMFQTSYFMNQAYQQLQYNSIKNQIEQHKPSLMVSSEPVIKESSAYKQSVKDWLKQSNSEKIQITFTHPGIVALIVKMYQSDQIENPHTYSLFENSQSLARFPQLHHELDKKCIKRLRKECELNTTIYQSQMEILKLVRIYDNEQLFDSILIEESASRLIELCEIATLGNAFQQQPKVSYNNQTKAYQAQDAVWFVPTSYHTCSHWIVNEIEKSISIQMKNTDNQKLLNVNELQSYWKNLEKAQKKQILSQATTIYKDIQKSYDMHTFEEFRSKMRCDVKWIMNFDEETRWVMSFLPFKQKFNIFKDSFDAKFKQILEQPDCGFIYSQTIITLEDTMIATTFVFKRLLKVLKLKLKEKFMNDLINTEDKCQKPIKTVKKKNFKNTKKSNCIQQPTIEQITQIESEIDKNTQLKSESEQIQHIIEQCVETLTVEIESLQIQSIETITSTDIEANATFTTSTPATNATPLPSTPANKVEIIHAEIDAQESTERPFSHSSAVATHHKLIDLQEVYEILSTQSQRGQKNHKTMALFTPPNSPYGGFSDELGNEFDMTVKQRRNSTCINPKFKKYRSGKKVFVDEPKKAFEDAIIEVNELINQDLMQQAQKKLEDRLTKDMMEFNNEILQKCQSLLPYRQLIYERIYFLVKNVFIEYNTELRLYGSCATGLALPDSDLDLIVLGLEIIPKNQIHIPMNLLGSIIKEFNWVQSINVILTSNVPVIKLEINPNIVFQSYSSKLPQFIQRQLNEYDSTFLNIISQEIPIFNVDITFNQFTFDDFNNHEQFGLASTDLVIHWIQIYSELQPLVIFFKTLIKNRGLHLQYLGGLSSFCTILLVVAFIEYEYQKDTVNSLGSIFISMLDFYGNQFDVKTQQISYQGYGINPFIDIHYHHPMPIQIVSPLNNKVISSSCGFIQVIFRDLQDMHTSAMELQMKLYVKDKLKKRTRKPQKDTNFIFQELNKLVSLFTSFQ